MQHALRGMLMCVVVVCGLVVAGCSEPTAADNAGYPLVQVADAELSEAQRRSYEGDAVRLALRYLADTRSARLRDVEPPAALVASLFNALVRVHASTSAARDSVIELHRIHTFPNPATREIMVRVDPSQQWTSAWRAKRPQTGNAAVDELVTRYDLSVVEYFYWSIGEVALLRAARPLNATALAERFAPLAGVIWAERNGAMGDGNDIRARPHDGGWSLDYSVGFGDCPAGCIGRHTWSFSVSSDGRVSFMGSSRIG